MQSISFGYVKVATAGTPVSLASVMEALSATADKSISAALAAGTLLVHKIEAYPLTGNTGNVYVGLDPSAAQYLGDGAAFDKTTGVNALKEILPSAASGHNDFWCVEAAGQQNTIRCADYAFDADTDTQGFVVSAVIA
jgi:hypothetical protein